MGLCCERLQLSLERSGWPKENLTGEYNHMGAHLNSSPRRKKLRQALQLADTMQSIEELTAQEKKREGAH